MATSGDEVADLMALAGTELDPWQRLVLRDGLGERADGSWSSFEVAMILARWAARRISAPFEQLTAAADGLGRGRFDIVLPRWRIAEADAAGEALSRSAAAIDDLLRHEREFVRHASHQLRTPLAGLVIHLERDPPDVPAALERAQHLETTIADLVALRSVAGTGTCDPALVAAEAVARFGARRWNVPTTIARLSVPYGDNGGWPAAHLEMMAAGMAIPVHPERPNRFNPIHEDDVLKTLPGLLAGASVPATTVNWGGTPSSIEEWCEHIGAITGLEPTFVETDQTISSVCVDTTRLVDLAGPPGTDLEDGILRMVTARRPNLVRSAPSTPQGSG